MTSPEQKWRDYTFGDYYYKNMIPYYDEVCKIMLDYYRRKFSVEKIPFAIDCACGSGQMSERLGNDCDEVLAVDISPNQIEVGKQNSTHPNVTYKVSSVYEMSQLIPEDHVRADLMTCNSASHYFNNAKYYEEVRKCLKVGGILAEGVGNFDGFVECGDEMYEENLEYMNWLITGGKVNTDYNDMYEIKTTGYKTLNVLLENVERVESRFSIPVTIDDMICYGLLRCPTADLLREKATIFYKNVWAKYANNSDKLTAKFRLYVVFSQNMKKDQ